MSDRRIVLFGATGYTGELAARELITLGARPALAGRSLDRLAPLADELGGLDVVEADAADPDGTILAALEPQDVLLTTVGPFRLLGEPAVRAAVNAGAHYVDSTGESPFIRRVFEEFGPQAQGRSVLLPAFGYDFVPGNLVGALALREAEGAATRIDVCYLNTGGGGPSSGTAATAPGMLLADAHTYRDGRLVRVRIGERVRAFERHDGRERQGLSIGATEHLSLPRVFPQVREVNVHLGWFGGAAEAMSRTIRIAQLARRLPGAEGAIRGVTSLLARRTGAGPDEAERARTGSYFIGEALGSDGEILARVWLEGPNGYTLTARLLAWGARRLTTQDPQVTGAAGPVEAFGLEALEEAMGYLGLERR